MAQEKFKIWMHLERIYIDDKNEEKYESLDDFVLPLSLTEVATGEEAIEIMEKMHDDYFNSVKLNQSA